MIDTEKAFNPAEHLMNVGTANKPRMYLEVKYRLIWLREQHPDATIETEILHLDLDKEVSAEVFEWDEQQRKSVKVTRPLPCLVTFTLLRCCSSHSKTSAETSLSRSRCRISVSIVASGCCSRSHIRRYLTSKYIRGLFAVPTFIRCSAGLNAFSVSII